MYFLFADLEQQISAISIKAVAIASVILIICTILALGIKKKKKLFNKLRAPLFWIMAIAMVATTAILFGGTIYLNQKSESKGPVHWHAGIEFWACGSELELRDPNGFLSNKIGTNTYHEHNDKIIHLEGVVLRKSEDASLRKFMRVTGGYIESDRIGIPLNSDGNEWFATAENDKLDGDRQGNTNPEIFRPHVRQEERGAVLQLQNGMPCNGEPAELQTFVIRFNKGENTYTQTKLDDPSEHIIRDESSLGPPSDCIIVEFDTPKERTSRLCQQYGVRDQRRCVEFGVKEYDPKHCNIREVPGGNQ